MVNFGKNNHNQENSIPLVIASKNVHKIRELKFLLKKFTQFDLLTLHDFPNYSPPEENGITFKENSSEKALHCAKEIQQLVIADDSGLVVPLLNGSPGVFSARYAGNNASDSDNRKKLLTELNKHGGANRFAYFECCLSLASPKGLIKTASATCEGELLTKERGGGGFGYDPLFVKHEYSKTFAELEESIKNQISHRAKAFEKLEVTLEMILDQ